MSPGTHIQLAVKMRSWPFLSAISTHPGRRNLSQLKVHMYWISSSPCCQLYPISRRKIHEQQLRNTGNYEGIHYPDTYDPVI